MKARMRIATQLMGRDEGSALLALAQTDAELGSVDNEQKTLSGEVELLEARIQQVQLAAKKLEDADMSTLGKAGRVPRCE